MAKSVKYGGWKNRVGSYTYSKVVRAGDKRKRGRGSIIAKTVAEKRKK